MFRLYWHVFKVASHVKLLLHESQGHGALT
jgi:hypothetical protein